MPTATTYDELIRDARTLGRAENDERAERWLTATASILADWGGSQAKSILSDSLPSKCLSGKGSSGRSFEKAMAQSGGDAVVALQQEAEKRTRQPDPRNVAMMLRPLMGLIKREVAQVKGPSGVDSLIAAMPAPIRDEVAAATTKAPFGYRLIPQSYARPNKPTRGH